MNVKSFIIFMISICSLSLQAGGNNHPTIKGFTTQPLNLKLKQNQLTPFVEGKRSPRPSRKSAHDHYKIQRGKENKSLNGKESGKITVISFLIPIRNPQPPLRH